MVAVIGGALTIPAIQGVIATGAATGAASGVLMGVLNAAITKGPIGTAVEGAAALGASASAILGSVAAVNLGATGTSVVAAAVQASLTGAGTASVVSGAAGMASGILSGPVGWCVLGATHGEESCGSYTFDCWKQVLHDDSSKLSNGKMLKEVIMDPRIKKITATVNEENNSDLPNLVLENVWDEQFRIDYVFLPPFNRLAAHAVKI
ncbi:unnamed protein product [Rotaria sordida]|uniref:Uncharacterized protein n=1 Tax=Rotaria sordida TaxID=392033 RepID=A0A815S175_9BILA|nr:unnamed protein product [Rotaria sordida]